MFIAYIASLQNSPSPGILLLVTIFVQLPLVFNTLSHHSCSYRTSIARVCSSAFASRLQLHMAANCSVCLNESQFESEAVDVWEFE